MPGGKDPHVQKQYPASSGRQPKAPRPLPRLRTKTGCLTCRSRRKKCDEKRKSCTGCRRNRLSCRWPESLANTTNALSSPDTNSDRVARATFEVGDPPSLSCKASTVVEIHSGSDDKELNSKCQTIPLDLLSWKPPNVTSPQAQMLLQYFIKVFVPPLIRPNAHRGFFDHSYMLHLSQDNPLLMDAFLCCSALRLSYTKKDLLPEALRYYSSAINNTRRMIDSGELRGTEDWLIVMAIFLCLFERWQPGHSNAIVHLQGAGELFALRRSNFGDGPELITPFHRLYAESILYNTTISALLCDEVPSHERVWNQISHCFATSPYPDTSQTANSPVLGVSPKMYCLVLETSCMVRCWKLDPDKYSRIAQIQNDLKSWLPPDGESIKRTQRLDSEPLSPRLYAIGTDILLFKMMHPHGNDNDPHIQNRVQQGLEILDENDNSEFQANTVCWPILILGCAAVYEEDYMCLLHRLEKTWHRSGMGDSKRAIDILKLVWERRKVNIQYNMFRYGSDVFLQKQPIFEVE